MADEDVKIVIKQKGTIPVYTKTKVGVAEVHHDETLKGSGTINAPLGISDEVMEEIENAGKVDDVRVDGVSVVTNKIAEIDLTGKVDKTSEADKVYGTDAQGNQTTYDVDGFGKVDDVKVNGVSVVENKIANVSVPTKTSDITNDSGFITKDVNDLTNYTKTEDLADVALTGDYGDLENTPTNVSDFTNDADYQNATQVSNTVSGAITTHNTSNDAHSNLLTPITQDIDAIEEKIPAEASSSNQLADKDYVDSQIGDLNEWTTAQYTPTTTNFVVGQTYTVEEAFQRTASLFEGQQGEIDDIEAVIPAQATTQNQLADKNFVNATVATNSANFRGNWATWADVPTQANLYPEDYVGSRTPTNNDYMVVSDASAYVPDLSNMPRVEFRNMRPKPDGVQGASICDVFYYPDGITEVITYNFECINNGIYTSVAGGKVLVNWWYGKNWTIKANATVYYNESYYNSGDVIYKGGNRDTIKIYFLDSVKTYEGSWRFMYVGTWATDGKNGWHPVYQIGTAFTQEQQAAIDSGITANMVDNYVNPNSTAATAYNARITAVETDKRDIINSANKVYATDNLGANKNDLVYDKNATAETIAQRGTDGVLKVGTPVDNSDAATKKYVDDIAADKQDVIDDLSTIRSGASLGATSLQPGDNVSELTNDAGYTTNVGTVTSVNNTQPDENGNVNITTTGATWGSITGTLSGQTDLQEALDKRILQDASLTLFPVGEEDDHVGEIRQYIGADYPLNKMFHGYFYQWTKTELRPGRYSYGWEQWNVQPQGGGAVSDLTDVTLTDLSNGQVLVYNSSTNKWVNDDQHGGVTITYNSETEELTIS